MEVRKATVGHPVKLVLFDDVCLLATYSLHCDVYAPALVARKGGELYKNVAQSV